jgi:peptide/nickel transport system permease protein
MTAVWILRRIAFGLGILWLISTLVFVATYALPADPAQAILGRATPAQLAALRHELGLDRPLLAQYLSWLGSAAHGDLGMSLAQRIPVLDAIASPLMNTLFLLLFAGVLSVLLGVTLGIWSAARRGSLVDRILLGESLVFTAVPDFVLGVTCVMLFSTSVFHILPAVSTIQVGQSPLTEPTQLILPVATLVLVSVPYIQRLMRASMVEALMSDYVAMARLKGVRESKVLWYHALPNAAVSSIQASAITFTYLLSGVVVVEFVFNYPGLGSALVHAVDVRDVPIIQGIVLLLAAGVVIFNIVADLLTIIATPRLRAPSR